MIPLNYSKIPVPHDLRYLLADDAPELVGTHEVARLLEHWGFARDGRGAVRKLVNCGQMRREELKSFSGWRFKTLEVLSLYFDERNL